MRFAWASILSLFHTCRICRADPTPAPDPEAQPNALPEALPEALPIALAEPEPQYTNNAPFSGAIYIVNPNGQGVTTANTNVCPSYASVSCSSIGQPSFCCPNGYTCANPGNSNGLIGCCPAGSACGGTVNGASVTTVTIQNAQQTSYVYVQPNPTQVTVYNQPTQQGGYQQGFCSTLTANGPGLPTTRQGDCGVILVVSEGTVNMRVLGYGSCVVLVLLQAALLRMFR